MLGADLIPEDWNSKWNQNQAFILHTSGSTGTPKQWILQSEWIQWSAWQTRKHFIRTQNFHQLIALPLDKVGGFMQWARAKTWQTPFDIITPKANPLLNYTGNAAITSFTPMQIEHILDQNESSKKLAQFESILIGGGPISKELEEHLLQKYSHIHWVHTFGMTETYSHFAGRTLGENAYHTVDDTEIEVNNTGLILRNPVTQNMWLQTHDSVKIINSKEFIWLGRTDFTINSGGVKIQLEEVENEIQKQTQWSLQDFFCWWQEDVILGQRLVLITKKHVRVPENWRFSSRYFEPKNRYILDNFKYSNTGKILRKDSFELLKST